MTSLKRALLDGSLTPLTVAERSLARANGSASRNTYLWQDWEWLLEEAHALIERDQGKVRPSLWGVPVSVKDCFDLAGTPTSCGVRRLAERPVPTRDSAVVERLRAAGALLTGKTHLHPLAYGITGENPDYHDCLQPRDASMLTGGSSSGAAASVQEGSALVAIGTDTGGSIRVPAALCGLVGYRGSVSLAPDTLGGLWEGGAHLAPSFDTLGFLVRDPRDVAPVAEALFSLSDARSQPGLEPGTMRVKWVGGKLLTACEPGVQQAFAAWRRHLTALGVRLEEDAPPFWAGAVEIFSGIQAHEAAALYAGDFNDVEPKIRDRLLWGASLQAGLVEDLKARLKTFQAEMAAMFTEADLLMLPAAPISRLPAGSDLSEVRAQILRLTTPFSLAGLPALSLPGELVGAPLGTGVQIAARAGGDASLLQLATMVGASLAETGRSS